MDKVEYKLGDCFIKRPDSNFKGVGTVYELTGMGKDKQDTTHLYLESMQTDINGHRHLITSPLIFLDIHFKLVNSNAVKALYGVKNG